MTDPQRILHADAALMLETAGYLSALADEQHGVLRRQHTKEMAAALVRAGLNLQHLAETPMGIYADKIHKLEQLVTTTVAERDNAKADAAKNASDAKALADLKASGTLPDDADTTAANSPLPDTTGAAPGGTTPADTTGGAPGTAPAPAPAIDPATGLPVATGPTA